MTTKHQLSFREREQLVILFAEGKSVREASRHIGRHHSCVLREIEKTAKNCRVYSAIDGQIYAEKQKRKARRKGKIESNEKLKNYIHEKLTLRWSPEQIAHTLKNIYRTDMSMQVSHESIYTYIYILPRGELRKELISYLPH